MTQHFMKKLYLAQVTLNFKDELWDKRNEQIYIEIRKVDLMRLAWANSEQEAIELLNEQLKHDHPHAITINVTTLCEAAGWPE